MSSNTVARIRAGIAPVAIVLALGLAGCASGSGGSSVPTSSAPHTPTPSRTPTPSSTASPAAHEIAGKWQLASGTDAQGSLSIGNERVTLTVNGADSGGQGPCNSYGVHLSSSRTGPITVTRGIQTQMACADPDRMILEKRYFAALNNATQAELDGGSLVLSGAHISLRYSPIS